MNEPHIVKKLFVNIIWIIIIQTAALSLASGEEPGPAFSIEFEEIEVTLQVKEIALKNLIDRIKDNISVDIQGLESRSKEKVTFSTKGPSVEIVLRKLLQHIGEKNFAYVYEDDRLIRINVFPQGTHSGPIISESENKFKSDMIRVVEVAGVLGDSQAEKLDIRKGDYVIKYDGVRISRPDELIKQTTKDKNPTPVGMIVLRDGKPKRIFLDRGFIGIRVRSKKIPRNEVPDDINAW